MTNWSKIVKKLNYIWTRGGVPEYRRVMITTIEQYLKDNPNWSILDAGCGTGLLFKLLSDEHKEQYKGIDFTPEMIKHCKQVYSKYADSFSIADITIPEHIPKSDMIITQNVIQHILPYQIVMKNIMDKTMKVLICCERTHREGSNIYGYEPIRWRFKDSDMLSLFDFIGKEKGFKKSKIIARPKSTEKLSDVLAIYLIEKENLNEH